MKRLSEEERVEVQHLDSQLLHGGHESARSRLRELMWLTDFAARDNAAHSPRFDKYCSNPVVVDALERDLQLSLEGIETKVAGLPVPSLVLHGEADPIGGGGPRDLARLLPAGRLVVLGGVGHVPWLEAPDELRDQLRSFVTNRDSPPSNST